jgi:hypothetical protein
VNQFANCRGILGGMIEKLSLETIDVGEDPQAITLSVFNADKYVVVDEGELAKIADFLPLRIEFAAGL